MDYFADDAGEYHHVKVPKDDKGVIDDTAEVTDYSPSFGDYDEFSAGCYESKDSIEKTEIKHVKTSKGFTCNGNGDPLFERFLTQTVERPPGTVDGKHLVSIPKDGDGSVLAHSLYLFIESSLPFSCDTFWKKRWVKCDACFQQWKESHESETRRTTLKALSALAQMLPAAGKKRRNSSGSTLQVEVTDYSEYSLAVFGDTKPIKEQLKAIGGKFNVALKKGDSKAPGWVVSKKQRSQLDEILAGGGITSAPRSADAAATSSSSSSSAAAMPLASSIIPNADEVETSKKAKLSTDSNASTVAPSSKFEVVDYSEYSLAVFGDTKPIKEQLKAIGAKFNFTLKKGDSKAAGWIVSKKQRPQLDAILATPGGVQDPSSEAGATNAAANSPRSFPAVATDAPLPVLPINDISEDQAAVLLQGMEADPEVETSKKAKLSTDSNASTVAPSSKFEVVDYSEYSLAVFGDTKPIKEQLKAIGAKFNFMLKKGDSKAAGWIVSKKQRPQLDAILASSPGNP